MYRILGHLFEDLGVRLCSHCKTGIIRDLEKYISCQSINDFKTSIVPDLE